MRLRHAGAVAGLVLALTSCGDHEQEAGAKAKPAESGKAMPSADELQRAVDEAETARRNAEQSAARVLRETQEAKATIERVTKQLAELDTRIADATAAIVDAKTDAERATAKARLVQLQTEKLELAKQLGAAQTAAEQAIELSKKCIDDPLAKGCS